MLTAALKIIPCQPLHKLLDIPPCLKSFPTLSLKTFSRSRTPRPDCLLWYLPLPFFVFAFPASFTYLPVVFEYLPLAVCTRVAVFRGRQLELVDGSVGRVMVVWGGGLPHYFKGSLVRRLPDRSRPQPARFNPPQNGQIDVASPAVERNREERRG